MLLQLFNPLAEPERVLAFAVGLLVELVILTFALWPMRRYVAQLKGKMQQLERASYIDPLTGLRSGAVFRDELDELGRRSKTVVVLYIDLDDFRKHNKQGHREGGDRALRLAADTMRRALRRKSDRLYRLHGDEFAAVMPNASERQAAECARAILRSLEAAKLSATIGAAASQRVGWKSLEHTADRACMEQKDLVKGRYLFATEQLVKHWDAQSQLEPGKGQPKDAAGMEAQL